MTNDDDDRNLNPTYKRSLIAGAFLLTRERYGPASTLLSCSAASSFNSAVLLPK